MDTLPTLLPTQPGASAGPSAAAAARPKWELPPNFAALLAQPAQVAVETLLAAAGVPLPSQPPAKKEVKAPAPSAPFLDALHTMPDAQTTNGAPAYKSTDSPLVDLFYLLTPGVGATDVFAAMDKAWAEDPVATLKIVFQARSIHEGKGSKVLFFRCLTWLWEHHPRTMIANLRLIVEPTCDRPRSKKRDEAKAKRELEKNDGVEVLGDDGDVEKEKEPEYPPRPHGSYDDLIDLLVVAINGQLKTSWHGSFDAIDGALSFLGRRTAEEFKAARLAKKKGGKRKVGNEFKAAAMRFKSPKTKDRKRYRKGGYIDDSDSETDTTTDSENLMEGVEEAATPTFKEELCNSGGKRGRATVLSARAIDVLTNDPKFQALYIAVVDIFVTAINADLERLAAHNQYIARPEDLRKADGYGKAGTSPHLFGMSFAAKWAPTPGKSADKQLHLATALAVKLFPAEETKWARHKLQTKVLAPLRSALLVPETRMVQGPWKIDYPHVPARAMARHANDFMIHDPTGFDKYIMDLESGKTTVAGASLDPHEIAQKAWGDDPIPKRLANQQWAAMVEAVRSSSENELSNCIAIADVSGSMGSIHYYQSHRGWRTTPGYVEPIWPCISLTLLLAELARPPWNGTFITFSADPTVERLDMTLPLSERMRNLSSADWGMNTDYFKAMKAVLQVAINNKLEPADMVKKIFVFSDMQFDQSGSDLYGEAQHHAIWQMFRAAGYELPEMVYWNLNGETGAKNKPVKADTPGVSLVSGFSGALMKYFIRALGDGPEEVESEEDEEDEKMDEEGDEDEDMDEDWQELGDTPAAGPAAAAAPKEKKEKKAKKDKNPLDHVKSIIGAKWFDGVAVVD
ncbi:hypothetical protein Q8F55_006921 [Vanrija albida]|uniref:DUF2828 domain-containing protein n=1 Tax=Vanrija albida TaxID=181172 RepID=A0ABR3PYM0_9TREE